MKSDKARLPARLGVLPLFRGLPLAGLPLRLLTLHVGAALLVGVMPAAAPTQMLSRQPP